jgi:uncharacterized linocin/CFP29 family protein
MPHRVQPVSESPLQISYGADAIRALPIYKKLLVANEDPRRKRYHDAALKHATEVMGLGYQAAKLYAKHAASTWTWATAPWIGGKRNPFVASDKFGFANALLSEDDWRMLTDEVVQVTRKNRIAVNDLRSRGLTLSLPDIGVYQVDWQKFSDLEPAVASMSLRGNYQNDQGQFSREGVPVPIIHKDFYFDIRDLLASRRGGNALDTTHIAIATQLVAEREEQILMNGDLTIQFQGNVLYGYTTHPNVIPETTSNDFGTPANIDAKFRLVIGALREKNHRGPFKVYLNPVQFGEMKAARTTTSDITMNRFVLDQHPEIEAIEESPWVAAGTGVVVEMSRQTVDLAIAQDLTVVQWDDPSGAGVNIRVMSSLAPRIKSDAAGQTGVLYMTNI